MILKSYLPEQTTKFLSFLLIIVIFLPKITFYKFPGYWQGIRFEEITLLIFLFIIFKRKTKLQFDYIGKPFLLFFIYFLFSSIIGIFNGIDTNVIFYFRYIEYILVLLLLNSIKLNSNFLVKVFKALIIINLLAVLLQINGYIGVISSKGYFASLPFAIPYGIFGGPWELSTCMGLAYFIVASFSKKKLDKLIYLIPVVFLINVAQTKASALAFAFSFIFFIFYKDKKLTIILAILTLLLFVFFLRDYIYQNLILSVNPLDPFALSSENKLFITKITNLDLNFIAQSLVNLFVYQKPLFFSEIPNWDYLSFQYRINFWLKLYQEYLTNFYTIMFGSGFGKQIYIESFILRILFSFGIFGVIIILYLVRNIPLYLFVYLFLAGITLDLLISFKIFIICSLLIFLHKNNKFK